MAYYLRVPYRDSNNITVMATFGRPLLNALTANIKAQDLSFKRKQAVEVVDQHLNLQAVFREGYRVWRLG